jgi:hypothetical protein
VPTSPSSSSSSLFVASASLSAFSKSAITAASNLTEEVNKSSAVFKANGADVVDWSTTLTSSFGISQRAALSYAGVFGNLLVPMGFARKEAAGMSKELVELAGDMASFNNASPEEVLQALQSGLAGEIEPLRRYGVFLNQARIQHELTSKGIHGTWEQLTQAQKAWAAYQIILRDTKDQQGDASRTIGETAGQLRVLHAAIEDFEATVGKALIPEVKELTTDLNKWLENSENQEKVQRAVADALTVLKEVVHDVGIVIGEVDDVTGGWKETLLLLMGLKFASTLSSWTGALAKLIGSSKAATGLAGAEASSGTLLANLKALAATKSIQIAVSLLIYKKLFGDIQEEAGGAGDLIPVYRNGKWVDPITGKPVADQAYWNKQSPQPTPRTLGRAGVAIPTHFTPTHPTGNLPGFPAVDIMAKPGTPILAPEDGSITRVSGHEPSEPPPLGQGGPWGLSLYYVGHQTGNTYYMTHLVKVGSPGRTRRATSSGSSATTPARRPTTSTSASIRAARRRHTSPARGSLRATSTSQARRSRAGPRDTSSDPPPGGGGGTPSTNPLPAGLRLALSKAATAAAAAALTPGKADDQRAVQQQRAALEDEIRWLNAKLATKLGPEKRITFEDLLTGALTDLKGLDPTKKKAPKGATITTITSLRETVNAQLRDLPASLNDAEQTAVAKLKALRDHLKVGMTAKDLADTRAQIRKWGATLTDEIQKQSQSAADAAAETARLWQRQWQNDVDLVLRNFRENVVEKQLDDFDRATSDGLKKIAAKWAEETPEEKAAREFRERRDTERLSSQKADLQSQIADLQAQLGQLDQAVVTGTLIDIATGTRTPITSKDATDKRKEIQDQLLQLQRDFHDIELDEQQDALDKAADQSRKAADDKAQTEEDNYQRDRARQRQALSDLLDDQQTALSQSLDDWNTNLEKKKQSWTEFIQWLSQHGYSTVGLVNPSDPSGPGSGAGGNATDFGGRVIVPVGRAIPFASGGRVPGRYYGRDDTVMARLTPGETVIDRDLTRALEQAVANGGLGGGPTVAIFEIDGKEFARAVADPMTDQQARRMGYASQRN